MAGKHYTGETGTVIRVDCGEDISLATSTRLYCQKPDGTNVWWEATIYGTNYLTYTTVVGDLNQAGTYRIHSSLTLGGWSGLGEVDTFVIIPPFGT